MNPSLSLEEDISELIQCTICIELLHDTRVLSCGHTFCLRCLQRYGRSKAPGDSVACPVCRTQFQVPSGGFAGLPRNFLLEKILEIHAASVAEETWADWTQKSPRSDIRQRSVAVQSTQTTSTSTADTTTQDNPPSAQTSDGMQQVQQRQQPQLQQTQLQEQRQQTQQQSQQQQQHRLQYQNPVHQRRRPVAPRNGWSQRLLRNAFLVSLVLNFLLTGNLWYSLESIEEEKRNWTNREKEFEETIQKLQQENEENQMTIANHHLRCGERVESSLEECKNDLTFYKAFLQTVTKLLDSYTTPKQPTFSVI